MASISFTTSPTSFTSSISLNSAPSVTSSSSSVVSPASLPRFIALQAVSDVEPPNSYLVVTLREGSPYLAFTGETKSELVAHEVLYNEEEEEENEEPSMVMLRAPNGCFWQYHSPTRVIMADRETTPLGPTTDPACYFKLFRNSNGHLLFQSIVDGTYGKFISLTTSGLGFELTTIPFGDTPVHDTSALDVVMGIKA